ncbi:hypothetical protein FB451DRAFT_1181342 [Mycena latifolia]|nr:hypothetical protein FB451DRAFT_1181342 [Mycena latifolia]
MVKSLVQILALAVVTTQFAAASPAPALVTVAVPFDADRDPISGTIAGIDSLGRTTYILPITTVESNTPFDATVTLVEGSDYLSLTVDVAAQSLTAPFGAACGLKDGAAVCTEVFAGALTTTETISAPSSLVIDVAQTAAPASSMPSAGSSPPTGSGSSSAPVPSQTTNSSQKTAHSILGALVGLALAYQLA